MPLTKSRVGNAILSVLLILVTLHLVGCDKSSRPDEDELIHRVSVRFCMKVIADPNASERQKSLAKEILRKRENSTIEPEPILVSAGLTQPRSRHITVLVVGASDEDGDLAGIGIMERHARPDSDPLVIEEQYPVFGYKPARVASYYNFPVAFRKPNDRKNEKDWKDYLDRGLWDRDHMPELWVSIPDPGKVDVQIWIYDHAGHQSEHVILDNWIPSGYKE